MKKFFLSLSVIAASAGYVLYQYVGGGMVAATSLNSTPTPVAITPVPTSILTLSKPTPSRQPTVTTTPAPQPAPDPTSAPTPVPTSSSVPQGQFADGTYTGPSVDAFYGLVQVQADVQDGKLASVNFLQYPNDRNTSRFINEQAMPILQSEAIQAQSANVEIVSGATDTSQAFSQSLGTALAKAKN